LLFGLLFGLSLLFGLLFGLSCCPKKKKKKKKKKSGGLVTHLSGFIISDLF
jgi:hypothetical protein